MYESVCMECVEDGVPKARYVGESARSANERFNEHIDDAKKARKDSHIYKHWVNHHGGRETQFQFEVVGFFNTPLERQVTEAVRIIRTGADKILNSKAVFSRSRIPRIVAMDTVVEENLGDCMRDMEGELVDDEVFEGEKAENPRLRRREKLRDLVRWGEVGSEERTEVCEDDDLDTRHT